MVQRYHPDFIGYTNVLKSSQSYWLGTAALAGVALLIVYVLAARTAALTTKSRREGVIAAAVAVGVGSVVYIAASLLTYATEPAASNRPSVIAGILFFEPPLGLS